MAPTLSIGNARIWTGDPARPRAHSITIRNGRVADLDLAAGGEVAIDAGGRTITPGLIDAHLHLLTGGESLDELDLSSVTSREQFEAAIARRHALLPAGQWLIARGWSNENWPSRRLPAKSWLAPAGHRPVVCYRMDMHVAVVNDAVLERCPLAADPPGGRIDRDPETGDPTGVMVEAALWKGVNPLVPKADAATRRTRLLDAQRHAHGLGLTAVGTMEYARDVDLVYAPLRDRLSLRCRVTLLDRAWPLDFTFGERFAGDDRLAVIGYKAFIDGTLGSRTARMLDDYADDPGNRGLFLELAADGHLKSWVHAVAQRGFSPSLHAIGDEAARAALDAIDGIDASCRPRIEHAQQVDPHDLPRFAGVIVSMQPLHKADDGRYLRERLGERRLAGSFAFRTLRRCGGRLAFGSDWPVVSCDPLAGIRAAVTGLTLDGEVFGARENLTVEEALEAYTAGAAYALGLDEAGCLRPGALGDLVVFDRDPFSADWAAERPRIVMTVVGGVVVYDDEEAISHKP